MGDFVRFPLAKLAIYVGYLHRRCVLCQSTCQPKRLLCSYCQKQMQQARIAITLQFNHQNQLNKLPLYPVGFYQYPMNFLITSFKEEQNMSAFLALVDLLYQLPKPKNCNADNTVIVPVPSNQSRIIKRGLNPVLMLAEHLSHHWKLPIWQGIVRSDKHQHQRGLDKKDRFLNIQDEFSLKAKPPCLQVILFDDVVTTGATILSIAHQIKQSEPKTKLLAICLAHGTREFNLSKNETAHVF